MSRADASDNTSANEHRPVADQVNLHIVSVHGKESSVVNEEMVTVIRFPGSKPVLVDVSSFCSLLFEPGNVGFVLDGHHLEVEQRLNAVNAERTVIVLDFRSAFLEFRYLQRMQVWS